MIAPNVLFNLFKWIRDDYTSYPFRFTVELFAWLISLGCSLAVALTVPEPPFIVLYPAWILGCIMYAWASYSRKSFGMLANYLLLVSIDTFGLIRLVVAL